MKILVIGCEHSGTRWVAHLVGIHPDASVIHVSSPSAGQLPLVRIESQLANNEFDGVVLVFRDASCIRASQKVGGSFRVVEDRYKNSPAEEEFKCLKPDIVETWVATAESVVAACDSRNIAWASVSYETLLQSRSIALRQVFTAVNLPHSTYSYFRSEHLDRSEIVTWDERLTSVAQDGNAKYVVMPTPASATQRWIQELERPLLRMGKKIIRLPRRLGSKIKRRFRPSGK